MPFKYIRDPLFLLCVGLYLANRLILRPYLACAFLSSYLNDAICIPFWVPVLVYLMRKCHLRSSDDSPSLHEIVVPLLLWSVVFELWLPSVSQFRGAFVRDHMDVLWYTCGSLVAVSFWRWYYRPRRVPSH